MAEAAAQEETANAGTVPFATSLDDPRLEADLLPRAMSKRALVSCGAGCSVLTLARRYPDVQYTAFEPDPRTVAHVRAKIAAAEAGDKRALNVDDPTPTALNQCGLFEDVFAGFRERLYASVAPRDEVLAFFRREKDLTELDGIVRRWVKNPAWAKACEGAFGAPLRAVLGTEEARHVSVSWPEYVQKALERALRRDAAPENPFLALALLGMYEEGREPYYARNPGPVAIELLESKLADVPDLAKYDLVSLSSTLDLAPASEIEATVKLLAKALRPGAVVFMRQIGSTRSLRPFFEWAFWFDSTAGRRFAERDRSVLHNRFEVAVKR